MTMTCSFILCFYNFEINNLPVMQDTNNLPCEKYNYISGFMGLKDINWNLDKKCS